ncbi:NACHT domain-containing protein [Alkalinema sp. FACHB-956]|uniref:NACHT domain-containing protein n=1 Tax=Alkalinema sp. FACHB-956 TaxID=2692768 RepID=UPI00168812A5|nr:NACHT domain-containing protein [Alkalinema sp. FACHB-956]MBD2325544.1 NACHT domain-containing protein [Alkalinema sp. FACHB-956]
MGKRSVKASAIGIAKAKRAFERREWTQEYLASAVGLQTRQSIWKFFSGRPIERHLFIDICFQLDLDWQEIAELPRFDETEEDGSNALSNLEHGARAIVEDAQPAMNATMTWEQLWSVAQHRLHQSEPTIAPMPTLANSSSEFYIELFLSSQVKGQRWLEVNDFQPNRDWDAVQPAVSKLFSNSAPNPSASLALPTTHPFPGFACSNTIHTVIPATGLPAQSRWLIYGRPGSGKTTLLKSLAIADLAQGEPGDRLPILLPLHTVLSTDDFSFETLIQQHYCELSVQQNQQWLADGKFRLLLDGLDELPADRRAGVMNALQVFMAQYPKVAIVLTCRSGLRDVNASGFTTLELMDWTAEQIRSFVVTWAESQVYYNTDRGQTFVGNFLAALYQPQNKRLLDLAKTPLLLQRLCEIFWERQAFPSRSSLLCQEVLELLVWKRDQQRGISRQHHGYHLTIAEVVDLLGQIAYKFFEDGHYLFDKSEILPILATYLTNHTEATRHRDAESLWFASESLLEALMVDYGMLTEEAHSVYAFSYLTVQEYLVARRFATRSILLSPAPQNAEPSGKVLAPMTQPQSSPDQQPWLQTLSHRVLEPRWRTVIELLIELLPHPTPLFTWMKQCIDQMVQDDLELHRILQWLDRKAQPFASQYHPAALRAFYYLSLENLGLDLAFALDPQLACHLSPELKLDLDLMHLFHQGEQLLNQPTLDNAFSLGFLMTSLSEGTAAEAIAMSFRAQLPELLEAAQNQQSLDRWCRRAGREWLKTLRQISIEQRDLGYVWNLTPDRQEKLQTYYWANYFLVNGLRKRHSAHSMAQSPIVQALIAPMNHQVAN